MEKTGWEGGRITKDGGAHKRARQRGIVALDLFLVIAVLASRLGAGCLRRRSAWDTQCRRGMGV